MTLSLPLATAVITAVAVIGLQIIAGDGGASQAQGNGDLLLDWAIDDNTPTSVGVVDTECRSFSAGTLVQIDVIAVNANDWAALDFVIEYPSPAAVIAPGPNDGVEGGAFDFVPFSINPNPPPTLLNAGAENFLFPDDSDSNADYITTEGVSDSNSPHGISMIDNSLAGNSGSGGLARISLDTTGMATGVHTLSLSTGTSADNNIIYDGAIHSDASGFMPDNFGSVQWAIDTDCPRGMPTPAPTPGGPPPAAGPGDATPAPTPGGPPPTAGPGDATPAPTPTAAATSGELLSAGGDSDADDNDWLTVLYVAGGLMAAMAAVGAISVLLRRRAHRR